MSSVKLKHALGGSTTLEAGNTSSAETVTLPAGNNTLATETQFKAAGGRKNLIINGGFDVWQRGTSFDSSGYTADRWRASAATTSGMCQRSTDTPNSHSNYSLQINKGSGGGDGIYYRFEDSDIKSAYGKTVTISFYAKNVSGTTNLFIRPRRPATIRDDWSAINNLGDISIGTLTTGWVKYTKQLNVEDSGLGWGIGFITDAVNSTFVISQVQLEVGSTATDFEHRSYGEELALCQRYYWRYNSDSDGQYFTNAMILNNTTARGVVAFPTVMRTTPTCALSNSSHVFCRSNASNHQGTSSGFYAAGKESVLASLTTTGLVAGEGSYIYFDTAHPSKYFEADAEL